MANPGTTRSHLTSTASWTSSTRLLALQVSLCSFTEFSYYYYSRQVQTAWLRPRSTASTSSSSPPFSQPTSNWATLQTSQGTTQSRVSTITVNVVTLARDDRCHFQAHKPFAHTKSTSSQVSLCPITGISCCIYSPGSICKLGIETQLTTNQGPAHQADQIVLVDVTLASDRLLPGSSTQNQLHHQGFCLSKVSLFSSTEPIAASIFARHTVTTQPVLFYHRVV